MLSEQDKNKNTFAGQGLRNVNRGLSKDSPRNLYFRTIQKHVPTQFISYYCTNLQTIEDKCYSEVKQLLNDNQYATVFKPAMNAINNCATNAQFIENVINPMWLLFNQHTSI